MIPLNDNMAEEIYAMYKIFYNNLEEGSIAQEFCGHSIRAIESAGGAPFLKNLSVTLSLQKIREIWEKYQVIALREVTEKENLLLGCGNEPLAGIPITGEHEEHFHEEYVTINPDITMNPTVVGCFGYQKTLHSYLPKKFYAKIVGEACTIMPTYKWSKDAKESIRVNYRDEICPEALDCMKEGYLCYEMQSRGSLIREKSFETSQLITGNYC